MLKRAGCPGPLSAEEPHHEGLGYIPHPSAVFVTSSQQDTRPSSPPTHNVPTKIGQLHAAYSFNPTHQCSHGHGIIIFCKKSIIGRPKTTQQKKKKRKKKNNTQDAEERRKKKRRPSACVGKEGVGLERVRWNAGSLT